MTTLIFLGPTLPQADAHRILSATYLPPAAQGDVYRAVRAYQPKAIGLIDGQFLTSAAVWHRELLWAMDQGIYVCGAASMGALRAAELHPYGMVGIGLIVAAYRTGQLAPYREPFEDDDEVAVIHGPPELGSQALSDAMVDLRIALAEAAEQGVIALEERDALVTLMKSLYFPDRSFARLAEAAGENVAIDRVKVFRAWLGKNMNSQKRRDAVELLQHLNAPFQSTDRGTFRFERALVWERFVQSPAALSEQECTVLKRLGEDEAAWQQVATLARSRLSSLRTAQEAGIAVSTVALSRQLDRLRETFGLTDRAKLDRWRQCNGLSGFALAALLEREASVAEGAEPSGVAQAMLDVLRLTGRYARLSMEGPPAP